MSELTKVVFTGKSCVYRKAISLRVKPPAGPVEGQASPALANDTQVDWVMAEPPKMPNLRVTRALAKRTSVESGPSPSEEAKTSKVQVSSLDEDVAEIGKLMMDSSSDRDLFREPNQL